MLDKSKVAIYFWEVNWRLCCLIRWWPLLLQLPWKSKKSSFVHYLKLWSTKYPVFQRAIVSPAAQDGNGVTAPISVAQLSDGLMEGKMEMDLPFSALESQDNTFKAAICVRGVSYCSSQLDRPHHSVAGNGGDLQLGDHQTVPTLISTERKAARFPPRYQPRKKDHLDISTKASTYPDIQ